MKKPLLAVIPFNLPWEWSTDYTNQTAYELARKGNVVVCYMWSDYLSLKEYFVKRKLPVLIKRYSKNIYQFYPIMFIPFRRCAYILKLNENLNFLLLNVFISVLALKNKFRKKVLWIFDPRTEPLMRFFEAGWYTVYDCVDYFIGTSGDKTERKRIAGLEEKLTKEADSIFANSVVLKKHLEEFRHDIHLVTQGFRLDSFKELKPLQKINVLKKAGRPLIGFVGAVNYRIDYKLIYNLARRHKEWDFAIWGPELQTELFSADQKKYLALLKHLPNIILGKSDKKYIPGIVKQFDVGMIPYLPDDDFNKFCYPMKLFEFFYVGVPVVSTEIEELKRFPQLVKIAADLIGWEKAITLFVSKPWPVLNKKEERKLAIENSWENKIAEIIRLILNNDLSKFNSMHNHRI